MASTNPSTENPAKVQSPEPKEQTPLQVNQAPIEADDSAFSDYDDTGSLASSTQSLSSSILEHVYENGRRYHRRSTEEDQQYLVPSDETELDRLDMMHHLTLLVLGGELHKAPLVGDPHNVLDCGTGTGIWALDFGSMHPGSKVVGVDLAPNQPGWVYPNVVFETDDLEKPWTYKKNHFDYIHSRMVGLSIKDWGRYTQQMFDHTTPGGYVEIAEHSMNYAQCDDGSVPADSVLLKHVDLFMKAMDKLGVNARGLDGKFIRHHLEAAGFVDIKMYTYKVPVGPWPKNKNFKYMGAVCAEITKTGAEAYGMMAMTRLLGMPEEEVREIFTEVYKTIMGRQQHPYYLHWQIVARKPEAQA